MTNSLINSVNSLKILLNEGDGVEIDGQGWLLKSFGTLASNENTIPLYKAANLCKSSQTNVIKDIPYAPLVTTDLVERQLVCIIYDSH